MKRNHATDKIFPIVLSADEHAEIRVAAAQSRTTLSEYVRARVLGSVKRSTTLEAPVDEPAPAKSTAKSSVTKTPSEQSEKNPRGSEPTRLPAPYRPALPVDAFLMDAFGGPPSRA